MRGDGGGGRATGAAGQAPAPSARSTPPPLSEKGSTRPAAPRREGSSPDSDRNRPSAGVPHGSLGASPDDPAEDDSGAGYSRKVLHSFLWQGGGNFVGQAVSWLATLFVIRLLAPGDYGLMAMANVFFGLFFMIADLGFGSAAVQALELTREQLRRVFGIIIVLNVGAAALTFAGAPVIAGFFSEPRLIPIVRVLAVNFLFIALYILPQSHLLRDMKFNVKAKVDLGATVSSALLTLLLAALGYGVWSLVTGMVAYHGVRALLFNLARRVPLVPEFSFRSVSGLARFGMLSALSTFLFFLYGQADVVIGGRFLGADALGLYAVALSLASIPMEKVLPIITQVSFAAFSRIQTDRARVNRNLLRSVRLVSLACFPAFLGLAAVAPIFVPLVLGPRWIELVVPFQVLCLVLPLKAVASLFAPPLYGVGRPGVVVGNMATALGIMVVALLLGVRHGVLGLALAWLIAYPLVFALIAHRSLAALRVPWSDLLRSMAFPTLASGLMFAAVVGVSRLPGEALGATARLALLVGSGAAFYCALVYAFNRDSVMELVRVLRS
jgi:teichuronic acid exporter